MKALKQNKRTYIKMLEDDKGTTKQYKCPWCIVKFQYRVERSRHLKRCGAKPSRGLQKEAEIRIGQMTGTQIMLKTFELQLVACETAIKALCKGFNNLKGVIELS